MPEMNFQPITAPTTTTATTPTASSDQTGLSGLTGDAFLKLFVAQLKYQNPMEPMDSSQMMQQTSQFTQVETMQKLAATQSTIMGYQQMSTATDLIGKSVTALVAGVRTTGVVDRVQVSSSGPILVMGDQQIPLTEVVSVANGPTASATPAASNTAATNPAATTTAAPTSSSGSATPSPDPATSSTGSGSSTTNSPTP
jgi:flagellar basal-body rod modification protein FlgD